jgi:hypothetical protein
MKVEWYLSRIGPGKRRVASFVSRLEPDIRASMFHVHDSLCLNTTLLLPTPACSPFSLHFFAFSASGKCLIHLGFSYLPCSKHVSLVHFTTASNQPVLAPLQISRLPDPALRLPLCTHLLSSNLVSNYHPLCPEKSTQHLCPVRTSQRSRLFRVRGIRCRVITSPR